MERKEISLRQIGVGKSPLMEKRSIQNTRNKVFIVFIRHWTRGTCGRGKSSNKRTEKQQSFRDRQYTSRDAQKLRGRCHDGTNKDMSRYIHNGSVARGLLTIHHHTN